VTLTTDACLLALLGEYDITLNVNVDYSLLTEPVEQRIAFDLARIFVKYSFIYGSNFTFCYSVLVKVVPGSALFTIRIDSYFNIYTYNALSNISSMLASGEIPFNPPYLAAVGGPANGTALLPGYSLILINPLPALPETFEAMIAIGGGIVLALLIMTVILVYLCCTSCDCECKSEPDSDDEDTVENKGISWAKPRANEGPATFMMQPLSAVEEESFELTVLDVEGLFETSSVAPSERRHNPLSGPDPSAGLSADIRGGPSARQVPGATSDSRAAPDGSERSVFSLQQSSAATDLEDVEHIS
jgi:hypothetical protein